MFSKSPSEPLLKPASKSKPTFFAPASGDLISVHSLDFDGCIFNRNYQHSANLLMSNTKLWEYIYTRSIHAKKLICMVGSNRQSKSTDILNSGQNHTLSCFRALRTIRNYLSVLAEKIPCEADEYLLADAYGKKSPGVNFSKTLDEYQSNNFRRYDADEYIFDTSKLSVLYGQTHKIAKEHPDKRIEFNFYDDRYDILYGLLHFFELHPDMLPLGTKLKLRLYRGDNIYVIGDVHGTGPTDHRYSEGVTQLAQLATGEKNLYDDNASIREDLLSIEWNFISKIKSKDILAFKENRAQINALHNQRVAASAKW